MSTVSASVQVAVDPHTAFLAFTQEIDLWWVRSPISFYDSARAIAKRIEPGVGGRVVEVYGDDDVFEIARITIWEPGTRLSWIDTHDDVEVDVWFDSTEGGTTVRVDARVPEGGEDRGGTSFTRAPIDWFAAWTRRRASVAHEVSELPCVNLEVHYERPVTAMRWLAAAFGFDLPDRLPADESEGVPTWIESRVGDAALMLFERPGPGSEPPPAVVVPFVYVADLDAHHARAVAHGATIVEPIHQHGYRRYVCEDLEGVRWVFAQARPTMGPTVGATAPDAPGEPAGE
jgi:uncharacterized glyoxalase superfamily protein PhnB